MNFDDRAHIERMKNLVMYYKERVSQCKLNNEDASYWQERLFAAQSSIHITNRP